MAMDDYYGLLGVDPDSNTSDIKSAYRDKKAALDASGDKTEIARVNKAWNVLSDPYQRGRYDEQRSAAMDSGELEPSTASAANGSGERPRRRGLFQPAARGEAPPPAQPTIELPAGLQFADQRRRLTAMGIDLVIILALFIGSQVIGASLLNSNFDTELDRIDVLQDEIDDLDAEADDLGDRADDENLSTEERDAAENDEEELRDEIDTLEDEQQDLSNDLVPTQQAVAGAFFALGFLYLVVPSAMTGQTLGKRLQRIRVVRQDGSRLGWKGAFFRYGFLVLGTYAISFILGPLAAAIALIVVLGWMRNPNKQGMHDRLAKTVVVDA